MTAVEETQALRKYRLIAEIGRGGMADVYLAVVQGPAGFNKLVVIKKTRPELAQDPEFLSMFLDEARLAARLNHPNVVQTHEVGQDGDRYFIAMEYLDGQPLNRIRARAGAAFTLGMQVRVISDVLAGLHHAHELADFDGSALGVVHRDATPQNVFVTYDGLIKVVDFGIAKAVDSSTETRAGVVKGKVTYMAPEQAQGHRVDRRTDVFAAGVMLWEGIVGRRMWKGVPELTVVHELINGKMPSLREAVPSVSEELARICERALAPNPDDRYASALDMHEALERWLSGSADHPSAREVGKFIGERFAEDRAKVKALIEAQLHDLRWSGSFPKVTGVDLPRIDPGQVLVTPTGQKPLDGRLSDHPLHTPATAASSLTGSSLTRSSLTHLSAAQEPPAPPAKSSKPVLTMGVAAVAAVAVIVLGVRFLTPGAPSANGAGTATGAVVAPPLAPIATATVAPGQDAVKLTIRVSPASAKVYLDDVLLSAGGFEGKVVRSDRPRRVRAEAPHFVSKEESVTLGGDVMLSFALEKETAAPVVPGPAPAGPRSPRGGEPAPASPPAPSPPPVAAPSPAPAPPPAATPAPTGAKPKRTIDSDSPYAQ